MTFKEEVSQLPRWEIREPNDKEFQIFKRKFLLQKAQSDEIKELMRYIGELQSINDELKHIIDHIKPMSLEEYKKFMVDMMLAKEIKTSDKKGTYKSKRMRIEMEKMRQVLIKNGLTW